MFKKFNKIIFAIAFGFVSFLFINISAQAQVVSITNNITPSLSSISVKVNMARILRINAPAATVIVGNPGIADVTIQDAQTLILTGKSFGQTNLIILDSAGNPIVDTLLEVIQTSDNLITVYLGLARVSFSCEPTCQPTATLGDNNDYIANSIAASDMIENAAR
ncbi:Similar to secretin RcpA/CpaC, associated with Flp pilus assembly [hydrothermal vent metagenome]|uniref:Similar to secretin RcpA/CpaC, associated with Flp pilus assembly n=1 Tax=hydrothermal vent metagenome TaxID=652676 RepID=A0A3B0W8F6_9ZZZZ